MTITSKAAGLLSMDLRERGQLLERLIEGTLGLNKSQATEALERHFGKFDYKTLSRIYEGGARVQTVAKVEAWAEDQLRLRKAVDAAATVESSSDDVVVTGQTEHHISFKFKGVKMSGSSIEDVEVVAPIEYADQAREAAIRLMREVARGQTPGAAIESDED